MSNLNIQQTTNSVNSLSKSLYTQLTTNGITIASAPPLNANDSSVLIWGYDYTNTNQKAVSVDVNGRINTNATATITGTIATTNAILDATVEDNKIMVSGEVSVSSVGSSVATTNAILDGTVVDNKINVVLSAGSSDIGRVQMSDYSGNPIVSSYGNLMVGINNIYTNNPLHTIIDSGSVSVSNLIDNTTILNTISTTMTNLYNISNAYFTLYTPTLSYVGIPYIITSGVPVSYNPTNNMSLNTFTSTPVLPTGLSLDSNTGIITGTPSPEPLNTYTISAISSSAGLIVVAPAITFKII